jgi:hypothetical protein
MARLTWRQRLIAIAVGAVAAALQAYAPVTKAAHAAIAPATVCHEAQQTNC